MTAGGHPPERVLVVWCPDWPSGDGGTGTEPDAAHRALEFGQVVSVVEGFCPRVEVLRPGACAIGARGPARYFGGEDTLAAKIIEAVAAIGFASQVGIADGVFAAQLAAGRARQAAPALAGRPGAVLAVAPGRSRAVLAVAPGRTRAFLARFPVGVLDGPGAADLAGLLPRLGIRTLGEFAVLPAAEVANRFGTAGVIAHRLARGLAPRPLAPSPPSADLSVSREFDPPERQAEPVIFAAKALAEEMHNGLAASGLACVRVQVQAVWEDGRDITRLWRHDGLLTPLAVADRVRWQLADRPPPGPPVTPPAAGGKRATVRIAAPIGARKQTTDGPQGAPGDDQGGDDNAVLTGGIRLLRLVPDQLVRALGRQLGLWGDAAVSDRVARAALRVQAMLGQDAVTRPAQAGGRGPAEQVTLVPFGDGADGPRGRGEADGPHRPWPGRIPAPHPATVYPAPLPARVADDAGAAVAVSGRGLVSAPPARLSADGAPWLAVAAWAGPWPVAERWWDPRTARRRARFQLVTDDGTGWLLAVQDGRWLVEARYD